MVFQRIGNFEAFKEYMRSVFGRTEAWLETLDPAELDFPFEDPQKFIGLESEPPTSFDARLVRAAYLEEFERYLQAVRSGCRAQGIDYQLLRTDRPFDVALAAYLSGRLAKVKP